MPVLGKVTESGRAASCLSNMRQVAAACAAYSNEHNQTLPGPCYAGQNAYCRYYYDTNGVANDPAGGLLNFIAPYLGITPTTISTYEPVFMCPTFALVSPSKNAGTDWILNNSIRTTSGLTAQPFGYPAGNASNPAAASMRLADLDFRTSTVWMLTELDKSWYTNSSSGWYNTLPPQTTPLHGSFRNAIFFDFHAGHVSGTGNTPD